VSPESLPVDTGYKYPFGFIDVDYLTATASNTITLTFISQSSSTQFVARDYNAATGMYQTIPGAVITNTTYNGQPALQLTYTITDNGPLDSNPTVGMINDPVGLAIASTPSTPDTGYGQPQSRWNEIIFIFSVMALAIGLRLNSRSKI
jgi:hypothetical protein